MATKKKAKAPVAGSPVTIGGGGGIVKKAFIKFAPKDWDCDCANGRLTLKGSVISVQLINNDTSGSIHTGVSKIEIVFD